MPSVLIYTKDSENAAIANCPVTVSLITDSASSPGYISGGSAIVAPETKHSSALGLVTFTLPANSTITPNGSYYRAVIAPPGRVKAKTLHFIVTATPSSQDVDDILTEPPDSIDPPIAGENVSIVPFSTIAATNVQDALEELLSENSGGTTDHGALTGLSDDDHPQYHNDTRGDVLYYRKAAVDTLIDGRASDAELTSEASTRASADTTLQTNIDAEATARASADTTHAGLTAAHGATGAVVGTTNTQTLTNKTLTSPVVNSPTGIVKGDVGLGNVDNTSDANKPVSTATQTALDLKANLANAVMDGDAAGGVLSGTYPNPGFAADMATQAELDAAVDLKADKLVTANRQTGSYTLVLTDAGKAVEMNVGSANNLTVPTNASVAFATGTVIEVLQYGAGQTTITGAGVTFRSPGGKLKIAAQYGAASLRKLATDEWAVEGNLTT